MKNTIRNVLSAALLFLIGAMAFSYAESKPLVIRGGKIATATRGIIENGVILINEGKISAVGTPEEVAVPADAKIVEAAGCWIFPGFIDAFTDLGTTNPVVSENDGDEASSPILPHLRVIDGFDPANSFIAPARSSGVTTALIAPGTGNLLAGQSALVRLAGNDVAQMVLLFPAAMQANLGEGPKSRYGRQSRAPMTRMGSAALLRQALSDARAYGDALEAYGKKAATPDKTKKEKSVPPERDLAKESLLPVLRGELPLVVTAHRLDDILTALRLADEFKLRIILNGGAEAFRIGETLAARDIPVILGTEAFSPSTPETINASHDSAARLRKAGVRIAFQTGGVRNKTDLLTQARTAIEYGLSRQEALEALTAGPARIFGVDGKIGSIEKGKEADILIYETDPLVSPARPRTILIRGDVMK
jgi:imidazolonepropionase-like amidohydrolase